MDCLRSAGAVLYTSPGEMAQALGVPDGAEEYRVGTLSARGFFVDRFRIGNRQSSSGYLSVFVAQPLDDVDDDLFPAGAFRREDAVVFSAGDPDVPRVERCLNASSDRSPGAASR